MFNYDIDILKDNIKKRMNELGITQTEMGELLNLSQAGFSIRLRKGEFSFKELLMIFERLGATQEDICQLMKV